MQERLIENIRTTIIGILIIGGCVTMVLMDKATITEVSGWFTMGLGFLRTKDTVLGIKAQTNGSDQEVNG